MMVKKEFVSLEKTGNLSKMKENYYNRNRIQKWKIAEDVKHLYIGTVERAERWEKIKLENEPTVVIATPIVKPFTLNIN